MESERSRLLLVDSDKEVLLTVSAVLRRYLDVHAASTMEQANAVVRVLPFHVLMVGDTLLRPDGAALIGLEHAGRAVFTNREGQPGFCVRLVLPRRIPAKAFVGRSSSCPGSDCR